MTGFIEFNGQQISVDKAGYLLSIEDWSPDLAPIFVREFYLEYNTSPAMRALVKAMQIKFGPEKANSRYLFRLFKKGPAKQATKIAGLPKPAKCL